MAYFGRLTKSERKQGSEEMKKKRKNENRERGGGEREKSDTDRMKQRDIKTESSEVGTCSQERLALAYAWGVS